MSEEQSDVTLEPTYVVGVGASAGGLESLERFFGAIPPDTGMAFVVIQHLAPDHKSLMTELLSKHSAMRMAPATHGIVVEANHVYLIPPGHNLEVRDRRIVLTQRMDHPRRRPNYAVDQFFCSLALECAERAVGVVLSGTGSDGTHGAKAIKAAGGLVLAEDASTAKFGSMPRSVLDSGAAARALPVNKIPAEILRHAGLLNAEVTQPKEGLERIVSVVSEYSGIAFDAYKRTTVGRRIERRRITTECATLDEYGELLFESEEEQSTLARDLLVGVTAFFRDPDTFESLTEHLARLIAEAAARSHRLLRVWIPACSTGEEAYTIAILLHEQVRISKKSVDIKIFATDVNTESLTIAGRGRYPFSTNANVEADLLHRYFTTEADAYQARSFLRESIVFARHDILRDPPFTKVDLLSCRNMLIYFAGEAQRRVMSVFAFAMRKGGVLLLGSSETLSANTESFKALNERARIYENIANSPAPHDVAAVAMADSIPARIERLEPKSPTRITVEPGVRLLEGTLHHLGLPLLILNRRGELAYAFGDAAAQLRVPVGRAGWRAAELLPDPLAVIVSTAVEVVLEESKEFVVRDVRFETADGDVVADIRAAPVGGDNHFERGVSIVFDGWGAERSVSRAQPRPPEEDAADEDGSTAKRTEYSVEQAVHSRIAQLEQELERTRGRLQTTVEELEASNEELQATNEELVSSNEELQSTNEELQSLNEELHTVNAELQSKVEELGVLSADLGNLLRTMNSGLLFLDREGRVRRFNEHVLNIIPLLQHDVGRPIRDIAHSLEDVDLGAEVRRVIETSVAHEREVQGVRGRVFALGLQPFYSDGHTLDGVVVTTSDVTSLAEANTNLQVYSRLIDQSPSLNLVADSEGCVEYTNPAFCHATGLRPVDLKGQDLRAIVASRTNSDVGRAIRQALDNGTPWSGELWLKTATSLPLNVEASIFPVANARGVVTHIATTARVPT